MLFWYCVCCGTLCLTFKTCSPHECICSSSCEYLVAKLSLVGCFCVFVCVHKMWTWFMKTQFISTCNERTFQRTQESLECMLWSLLYFNNNNNGLTWCDPIAAIFNIIYNGLYFKYTCLEQKHHLMCDLLELLFCVCVSCREGWWEHSCRSGLHSAPGPDDLVLPANPS